ncbi:MAG: multifunctional CCA tRNA nucleotidyl transferase/2'3'-cyclic phosphodiesterase/2'nucleotidase/phosphatase [Thiogranum sp.]|nr:multifunctional CCA tRNA nucleotidyl transferase/2'3'-cyclic phosphodiesterase/2'nucleotidase/phosphatase [Thiogranum sp.]
MEVYLVGGAVRDRLLGLEIRERDWVVVGATPEQMLELGYRQVGKDFPVFLHPETGEEYALARTERKTGPGYKGFAFHASPDVTLEQDLQRRDLTINAMAEAPDGALIDPWHGEDDLHAGLLRHVSPAFAEDPVRILRVARLAAQLGKWGFKVAHGTNRLMRDMVDNGEVDHLVPERVWAELEKALTTDSPARFFTVLRGCKALQVLFPEIDREFGQTPQAHAGATVPALERLQAAAQQTSDPRVRFAVLLRDIGQDLSRQQRIAQAQALCERLRAPNDHRELALNAIRLEQEAASSDPREVLALMEAAGAFRQNSRWPLLLDIYQVSGLLDDSRRKRLASACDAAAAIGAGDVAARKLSGPAVGAAIRKLRLQRVRESLTSEIPGQESVPNPTGS